MKKYNIVTPPVITVLISKQNRFDRDGGEPLSQQEKERLTAWCNVTEDNQRMFDQLTGPLSAEQWVYLRQKLGFYEHLVMQFFKDSHPDKIRRDNAIIWLMAEMMVSGLKGAEQGDKMEVVQQWAEGSFVNQTIYEQFKEKMARVGMLAQRRDENYYVVRLKEDNRYFKSLQFYVWLLFTRIKREVLRRK